MKEFYGPGWRIGGTGSLQECQWGSKKDGEKWTLR